VGDRHGLILDYGGVLTASPFASFEAFCAVEGLARDAVRSLFRDDHAARDLLARLETGHLTAAEFEPAFAALLEVSADRLLQRMLFDGAVISSEVGLRKPDPAIYELAAERIGVAAAGCIYVDDLPGNLKPARELGMATVLHRGDARATLAEIDALLK
jgi:beta-phosphoglucomutase-like phosphatase (HAD superfamily)